jgi:hypothetical protein
MEKAVRLNKSNGFFAFHAPRVLHSGPTPGRSIISNTPHKALAPQRKSPAEPRRGSNPPAVPTQARTNHGNLMPIPSRHPLHGRFEVGHRYSRNALASPNRSATD